jgi:hypothetical protein
MSSYVWNKPVLCIFKERDVNPEIDPFVVVKAKKMSITAGENPKFSGSITDFFTLMGDADYLTTKKGTEDHYVICWFDDTEADTTKDLRRLRGVAFTGKVTCELNEIGKRTYNATFNAQHGKIK